MLRLASLRVRVRGGKIKVTALVCKHACARARSNSDLSPPPPFFLLRVLCGIAIVRADFWCVCAWRERGGGGSGSLDTTWSRAVTITQVQSGPREPLKSHLASHLLRSEARAAQPPNEQSREGLSCGEEIPGRRRFCGVTLREEADTVCQHSYRSPPKGGLL